MKTQTAFRIDTTLLEMIKEKAKSTNRSLNNYIEHLLYKDVGSIPNETTINALKETKTFTVLLNAAYLGKYYLPRVQVEAMYDNDYMVRTKGRWIEVVR